MDNQTGVTILEVLKWVGIVFAAGFIGYFGRYLGVLIIEKIRKKKPEPGGAAEVSRETAVSSIDLEKERVKLEKKRLKLEKKKTKKAEMDG